MWDRITYVGVGAHKEGIALAVVEGGVGPEVREYGCAAKTPAALADMWASVANRKYVPLLQAQYAFLNPGPRGRQALVAVIDDKTEAGSAPYLEFTVHRSAEKPELAVGSWRFAHGGKIIDQSKPGTPLVMEFRFAVDCADQHGISFVWVNDPEELFPPWERR